MARLLVRAWLFALTTVGLAGCGAGFDGDAPGEVSFAVLGLAGCTTYNGYTAALAEATIDCIGTIGPDSFAVDPGGRLGRSFSACTLPGEGDPLLRIDRLLSLQLRPNELPLATFCMAQGWTNWLLAIATQNVSVCPVWTKLSATGTATPDSVLQNIQTLPLLPDENPETPVPIGKEQFLYSVSLPIPPPLLQGCRTAQSCASVCSGGLAGFFAGQAGPDVIGDPYWWLDPGDYGSNSPYRTPNFYHPMSYADDDVPGAIYGDYARRGDACSWWNGDQHVYGTLLEDKLVPSDSRTWSSRCH
jgi:hypothetical protein